MTVTLLLFASYADAIGKSSVDLDVRPGATVNELLDRVRTLAGAERLPTTVVVAVNEEYASGGHVLSPGDEVALIPPVAGG